MSLSLVLSSAQASFEPAAVLKNFFTPSQLRSSSPSCAASPVAAEGIRVIGAGPGRTGTDSLWTALNQLGSGPTYHMKEAVLEDSGISTAGHFAAFKQAVIDQGSATTDWAAMLDGFHAGVDFPFSVFFEELAAEFPHAKVVLTVRPATSWFRSINKTICHFSRPSWVWHA